MPDETKARGKALLEIQNNSGIAVTYQGKTYANGEFVPITRIIKGGYTVQRAKQWGTDTGRSMTGKFSGTLLGIFPKITVKLGKNKLSETDIQALSILTDQSFADCWMYDVRRKKMCKKTFYFDDFTTSVIKIKGTNIMYDTVDIVAVVVDKFKY